MEPDLINLRRVDFLTIGTIGPPGQRTFFLQAAQDALVVTLIIEKQQATAIAIAIGNVLAREDEIGDVVDSEQLGLILPVRPLFRVGRLNLGRDEERDLLVLMAEELTLEEDEKGSRVHIWATPAQMLALAREAVVAVASGRPICPLCHEVTPLEQKHVCVRGNGNKRDQ